MHSRLPQKFSHKQILSLIKLDVLQAIQINGITFLEQKTLRLDKMQLSVKYLFQNLLLYIMYTLMSYDAWYVLKIESWWLDCCVDSIAYILQILLLPVKENGCQ